LNIYTTNNNSPPSNLYEISSARNYSSNAKGTSNNGSSHTNGGNPQNGQNINNQNNNNLIMIEDFSEKPLGSN
jgi:hypothetical protein